MAEAAPDHSASRKIVDVDDLFQILVARGVPPRDAKRQILEFLQLGKVLIGFHIAAGARKTRPTRQATDEELKAQYDEQSKTLRDLLRDPDTAGLSNQELGRRVGLHDRVVAEFRWVQHHAAPAATTARSPHTLSAPEPMMDLDFLYERSPPGGITGAVDPGKWDVPGVLFLNIKDGHLVVEPQCSLDFPWQSYSFSISNPVVVDHLWPEGQKKNDPASNEQKTQGAPVEDATKEEPRPPPDAGKVTHLVWAYGQLLGSDQLAGLRGKALLHAVCTKVGPKFTAGPSTLKRAIKRYKETHSI